MSKRKNDMHQIENAHLRQPHFTYWLKGLKVIFIRPLKDYREYLVVTEDDNYHIIPRQDRHLALTKERSLIPKKVAKWFWDEKRKPLSNEKGKPVRVEYKETLEL